METDRGDKRKRETVKEKMCGESMRQGQRETKPNREIGRNAHKGTETERTGREEGKQTQTTRNNFVSWTTTDQTKRDYYCTHSVRLQTAAGGEDTQSTPIVCWLRHVW